MLRSIVVENLFRQCARTALTALGIAIGIATVLALGAITTGRKATMGEFHQGRRRHFLVARTSRERGSDATTTIAVLDPLRPGPPGRSVHPKEERCETS